MIGGKQPRHKTYQSRPDQEPIVWRQSLKFLSARARNINEKCGGIKYVFFFILLPAQFWAAVLNFTWKIFKIYRNTFKFMYLGLVGRFETFRWVYVALLGFDSFALVYVPYLRKVNRHNVVLNTGR